MTASLVLVLSRSVYSHLIIITCLLVLNWSCASAIMADDLYEADTGVMLLASDDDLTQLIMLSPPFRFVGNNHTNIYVSLHGRCVGSESMPQLKVVLSQSKW